MYNMNTQNEHDAKAHTLNPTDNGFVKPNWLKFIPQTSPDTYYSPRYLILQFLLERIMVNVLLHQCCAAQINSSQKLSRGAVMRPFIKRSISINICGKACKVIFNPASCLWTVILVQQVHRAK